MGKALIFTYLQALDEIMGLGRRKICEELTNEMELTKAEDNLGG
jgi:hypothetical protein